MKPESLAFACFVAGTVAFIRFFLLVPKLKRERIGEPATKLQDWFPWLPGNFTSAGQRVRRQMNALLIFGWILLIAGLVLSSLRDTQETTHRAPNASISANPVSGR